MNIDRYSNRVSVLNNIMLSLIAIAVLATFCTVPAFAQDDIEIVNQDGERVDGARLVVKPESDPVEAEDPADDIEEFNPFPVEAGGRKLTYTDSDGNEKQVDLETAQSVVVQQSTQSVTNNGRQETKVVKKMIVVDANGQRHEIDTGDNDGEGLDLPDVPDMPQGFPHVFGANRNSSKYMIGVHCGKVSPALQAQLGLADDGGLLVIAVGPDSPAEAAGLQKHDILMFADDKELVTQEDLVRVAEKAGKAGAALSLTVIRGGKEIGVDVLPVERTAEQLGVGLHEGMGNFDFGPFGMDFGDRDFDPFAGGDNRIENMRQQMEQVQKQMQEMQQRMRAQLEAGE